MLRMTLVAQAGIVFDLDSAGLTQFTRTSGARLIASAWVSAKSPPLLAE
jgi:hypothetical protein